MKLLITKEKAYAVHSQGLGRMAGSFVCGPG